MSDTSPTSGTNTPPGQSATGATNTTSQVSPPCLQAVTAAIAAAAQGFAIIGDDFNYQTARVWETIPNEQDWDEFSSRLVSALEQRSCVVGDSALAPFWQQNAVWMDLIAKICQLCY